MVELIESGEQRESERGVHQVVATAGVLCVCVLAFMHVCVIVCVCEGASVRASG